jgi:sulfur-oxidizing protein SoxY
MESNTTMNVTRRRTLALAAGAAAAAMLSAGSRQALASAADTEKLVTEFTGGKTPEAGKITLTAPEIAENGNTVPIAVSVDSAMTGNDLVDAVMVVAEENPHPGVITIHFTEMSGKAVAATRIRLAKTQTVTALARMKDGSVYLDKKQVKVTIGGCGG